jgi:hypothetical protein
MADRFLREIRKMHQLRKDIQLAASLTFAVARPYVSFFVGLAKITTSAFCSLLRLSRRGGNESRRAGSPTAVIPQATGDRLGGCADQQYTVDRSHGVRRVGRHDDLGGVLNRPPQLARRALGL